MIVCHCDIIVQYKGDKSSGQQSDAKHIERRHGMTWHGMVIPM